VGRSTRGPASRAGMRVSCCPGWIQAVAALRRVGTVTKVFSNAARGLPNSLLFAGHNKDQRPVRVSRHLDLGRLATGRLSGCRQGGVPSRYLLRSSCPVSAPQCARVSSGSCQNRFAKLEKGFYIPAARTQHNREGSLRTAGPP